MLSPLPFARIKWVGAGLYLAIAGVILAATNDSMWLAKDWQTGDGLPNNTVTGVAQTPDGYLWLATPTGLVRFDGVSFQEFSSTNYVALPNRGILMMATGRHGGLRLAMDRGAVVILDAGSSRALMPAVDLPDEVPYLLAEDREGALWVSYRNGTICRLKDAEITRFAAQDGLPEGGALCAITCDEQGRLWFAKNGHFGLFRNGRFETLRHIRNTAVSLIPARGGGVWLCVGTRLARFDEAGGLQQKGQFEPQRSGAGPSALLEDRQGNVWIGTMFNGLFLYNGSGFESIAITHKEVTSIAEDTEGNIWVGTTGGGLNRIRPRSVELEGARQGLPFEAVISLCQDTVGTIWAVTQDGWLARRSSEGWHTFTPLPDWNLEVSCVAADPTNGIWFGTRLGGLFWWHDGQLLNWGETNGLKGTTIHTLRFNESGDLWIGEDSPNAVQCLRNGQLFTPEAPPDEDLRVIRASTRDAAGNVWIGTSRGLLLRAEGNRLVNESQRITETTNSIRCLYSTADGSVWLGYAGWGVGRIKNGHYATISTDEGLYDDWISHIVADGHGWLWFGGDRGIFKVRQDELDAVAEGKAARVRSIHFGRGEGLPSLQATFGGSPGVLRSRDGRLWIPMRTGLAVVSPDKQDQEAAPPPVLIARMTVDGRTVALYSGVVPTHNNHIKALGNTNGTAPPLHLPPGHRLVDFDFTGLSYAAPENVQFRHRLEGYEDEWVEGSGDRSQNYSRLPYGKYQFHVIACNSDGVWNETGAVLAFVVEPFFWQTWLFRVSVLVVFTVSIIAIVRYVSFRRLRLQLRRFEQQEALHRERARIAKDIHDDVGANLTQIALLGELAHQDQATPQKAAERVGAMSSVARQAVRSLDEIVWAVNPRNDTLAHLIDYAGQFALDYLRLAGIRCRLDLPDETPYCEVSTDVRHNLFLIVKEALNNIVKHAHASEVWLRVAVADGKLRLSVEDDGRGFDRPPADAQADGLRNIRQRVADIRGQCRIESEVGRGTKVIVELPWPIERQSNPLA